jgi:hypothetical protein
LWLPPAVAATVTAVLTNVVNEIVKWVQEESTETIKEKIKEMFNPKDDSTPPLTKVQLEQVKKVARKQAIEFGMESDRPERWQML